MGTENDKSKDDEREKPKAAAPKPRGKTFGRRGLEKSK